MFNTDNENNSAEFGRSDQRANACAMAGHDKTGPLQFLFEGEGSCNMLSRSGKRNSAY
jgi:hypothetical protein